VDLLQDHLKTHLDHRYLTQPIIRMAENANVEVAINLDHGQDIAFVKQCLHEGFSSVMMDASMHPLEKNIAITKEIVQFAQAYNASVEAEVGDMGAVAGDQFTSDGMYTDPEEAIHFIRATGVDCLALSYGSSHGDYPAGYRPAFRFDIVQTIKEATDLPLVLHGGSGAGSENILRSVALGINKINVGADFMKAQRNALHQQLNACPESDYPTLVHQTIEAGKAVVKEYIELSGSKNKSL
jgi:fructose-bisphosphate aldolase class II